MAILTYINNIPLYSTINEALDYAQVENLQGYHVHKYKGVAGYMGGRTHPKGMTSVTYTSTNQMQTNTPTASMVTTTTSAAPSSTSYSGGMSRSGGY